MGTTHRSISAPVSRVAAIGPADRSPSLSMEQPDEFDVSLGPNMTFAISVYEHRLLLISVSLERFHELCREFTQLFFFSGPDTFLSWTKTAEEVSLIIDEPTLQTVPMLLQTIGNPQPWRAMQVHEGADSWGHPIAQTGIVARLSEPLAANGIAIFYVGTFSSDYVLVPENQLQEAKDALLSAAVVPTASPSTHPRTDGPQHEQEKMGVALAARMFNTLDCEGTGLLDTRTVATLLNLLWPGLECEAGSDKANERQCFASDLAAQMGSCGKVDEEEFVTGLEKLSLQRPHWLPPISSQLQTKPTDSATAPSITEANAVFQDLCRRSADNSTVLPKETIFVMLAIVGHNDELPLVDLLSKWQTNDHDLVEEESFASGLACVATLYPDLWPRIRDLHPGL